MIFPTIAIQLARTYAEFRSIFVPLVQSDPEIAYESLYNQMDKLLVQPLAMTAISTVVVIDALDECTNKEPASEILSVLGKFMAEIPNVKFFVTGRPERRIREGFRLPLKVPLGDVFLLHEINPNPVDRDIRLFFKHKFLELRNRRHRLDDWPTEKQLDVLCERTAGLFAYAAAAVGFIDQSIYDPGRQLDLLLSSSGRYQLGGAGLDSLYMTTLHEAFGDNDPEDDPKIRAILGAMILSANPPSPLTITTLLGLDIGDVFPVLSSINSLLVLHEDINQPVLPFHKSFPDFITDPNRCQDPRFLVHPPDHHVEILVGCLKLMGWSLERNMCCLPVGVNNSEVYDLGERVGKYISPALQYACRSWHKHLVDTTPTLTAETTACLRRLLETKFLFWLETLSLLGDAREAVDALEAAVEWLDVRHISSVLLFYKHSFDLDPGIAHFRPC